MDAMVSVNGEHKVVLFNGAAEQMFRCSAGAALGQSMDRFIPARFRERYLRHLAKFARMGRDARVPGAFGVLCGLRADGEEFPVEASVSQVKVDGQELLTLILRDITERRRAEEAAARLVATDRRLADIVQGMTEACFAVDREWRFTFVNGRGETLLRNSREQMVGKSMWEVFSKLVGTPMESQYRRAMSDRVPVAFEVFSPVAERWLDIRLFPTAEGLAAFLLDISERKRAEESFQHQQALLREMGQIAKVGGWEFDPVTGEGEWTEEVGRIHEWEAGRPVNAAAGLEHYPGQSRLRIEAAVKAAIEQARPYDLELEFVSAKGAQKWVRTIGHPILADGKVIKIRGSFQDITDRKRAEAAIRESEERLETVVQNLTEGLVISDLEGNLLHWNRAGLEMHDFHSLEEGLHHVPFFAEVFELSTLEGVVLPVEKWPLPRIIQGERVRDFEVRIRRRDRDWQRVFSYSGAIVSEAGGRRVSFVSITDITERKHAEEQLTESLKEVGALKAALDEHAIVAITDPRGKITFVNEKFCAISKYSREELIGHDHRVINSGYHSKAFFRELWTTIAGGHAWHGEIKNRAKDGSFYWVATTIVPFLDENGKPTQYIAIRADVTERKRAEDALRQANESLELKVADRTVELQTAKERAEQADRMKSSFLAAMSHELRTPLNGIIGFSDLLISEKPGPLNPKQKQYAEQVLKSGRHLLHLINDVLDLSKVEAGRMELFLEPFHLDDVIAEVCASTAPLAEEREISLRSELPPVPLKVTLDRKKIKQILFNLLSNAIKFTPKGGAVTISVRVGRETWQLHVQDTGVGIRAEDMDKLFVEFQQLSPREGARNQGTGLGLVLTKRFVELQGGTIQVVSALGKGSTFTLSFPQKFPAALS